MPYLYGNHILKAHLGRITEDTPEHQGVVVYSNMRDVHVPLVSTPNPVNVISLGQSLRQHALRFWGVITARSTVDIRKLDPTAIIVFHQAYVPL